MTYTIGTVVSWDPVTFDNTVRVGQVEHQCLPVLGAQGLTVRPGDSVALLQVGSRFCVAGKLVTP